MYYLWKIFVVVKITKKPESFDFEVSYSLGARARTVYKYIYTDLSRHNGTVIHSINHQLSATEIKFEKSI